MGRRATGASARMAFAFETGEYGEPAADSYFLVPFVSSNLGEEQGLIPSDLMGQGREPLPPSLDVANNNGDLVVPVDLRNFGLWLKLHFGAPVSTPVVAATGKIAFSAQPEPASTITLNGKVWTFVAGVADDDETQIGADLAATLGALAVDLAASAAAELGVAFYEVEGDALTIAFADEGVAGNSYTLAASPTSHAKVSGATLEGGAVKHVFTSGADNLPSADVEIGHPDMTPAVYSLNTGVRSNSIKCGLARSGMLNATINLIAQGELPGSAPKDATPTELAVVRFSQFLGDVKKDGEVLGSVVSAEWTVGNDLDPVEVIRRDGRIEDADPGAVLTSLNIVTRFKDRTLLDQATSQEPCEISFGHEISASRSILVTFHSMYLPKAKRPISGPKGIQTSFGGQGAKDPLLGKSVTVELTNDMPAY